MAAEKAQALVLRTTDWSETSRIATLWTREFGKVRVLAKGGRRLKSAFENALDLLTVCSIVFLRKSPGSLDLLTEAQVVRRFVRLRQELAALYAGYYIAELLDAMTQDYDPHPLLFEQALTTLDELGQAPPAPPAALRLARFEVLLLRELGYGLMIDGCAACGGPVEGARAAWSAAAGGLVCGNCRERVLRPQPISAAATATLRALLGVGESWRHSPAGPVLAEVRQVLGQYVTHLLGRRPRLLSYVGS